MDFLFGGLDGCHGAVSGGEGLHEVGAGGDQGGGVVQGEDSGDVGGADGADGVSGDDVGGDAPAVQQVGEGDLQGEQRRLGVQRLIQQLRVPGGQDDVPQWHWQLEMRTKSGGELVEGGGVNREGLVEFAAHACVLAALPGEQERGPRGGGGGSNGDGRMGPSVGQGV